MLFWSSEVDLWSIIWFSALRRQSERDKRGRKQFEKFYHCNYLLEKFIWAFQFRLFIFNFLIIILNFCRLSSRRLCVLRAHKRGFLYDIKHTKIAQFRSKLKIFLSAEWQKGREVKELKFSIGSLAGRLVVVRRRDEIFCQLRKGFYYFPFFCFFSLSLPSFHPRFHRATASESKAKILYDWRSLTRTIA